jgi:hypothetical protein
MMPLSSEIDSKIIARFGTLISDGKTLVNIYDKSDKLDNLPLDFDTQFCILKTNFLSLLEYLPSKSDHLSKIADSVRALNRDPKQLLGFIIGLQRDYKAEMLVSLEEKIEAQVTDDYMGQAEQLLGEGISGQYDHVPAAVLAGAVLEDALRRLCQRRSPPIDLFMPDGRYKTLGPLITDLQRANAFNKVKAEQLQLWAKIRNYAAHGQFGEFNRSDVETMIAGVKNFIGDFVAG